MASALLYSPRYTSAASAPLREVFLNGVKRCLDPEDLAHSTVEEALDHWDRLPGTTYYFVLDESGEAKAAEPAKTGKKAGGTEAKKPSLLQVIVEALTGGRPAPRDPYRFQQPRCEFDRLYFDLNGDRDLTNDGVIRAAEKPVFAADRSSKAPPLLRSGSLGDMQIVDGQYVTVSASPLGDKLSIGRYRGDFGVLEIGSGGRAITELGVAGQLVGRTTMVPLGESPYAASENLARRHIVPVGDYMIPSLTARYGRIRFSARMIPDASPTSGRPAERTFNVRIRKDKPYILVFSGKPEVKFASPKGTQAFKPGATVYIGAMLNEPWQGIQITGLWYATQKESAARYVLDGGRVVTAPQYAKLDPTIVIRDSAGKEVAAGKMPFG